MTARDWVEESVERYRTQPPGQATLRTTEELWNGLCRRTLDEWVGRPVWDRGDWDVLVVADAARVDLMREAVQFYGGLPNDVDGVWSNASCSIEWIDRTFNDHPEKARRTGYVTANPFAAHDEPTVRSADLSDPDVGHLRLLYQSEWQDVGGGIETVPPERVTDHAIDAWRRREELDIDRLIVHYMQPHEPYRNRPEWGGGDHKLLKNLVDDEAKAGSSVFPRVRDGDVSMEEFREVYLDNHHWLLEDIVDRLLGNVDGTVAITADHGNGLGEWGAWHHPPGDVRPAIRRVPWLTVESIDMETVEPDVADRSEQQLTNNEVAERLEMLGYGEEVA